MPQKFTVAEVCDLLDKKIKATPELQDVWVKGEITQFTRQPSSGHIYITLSDTGTTDGKLRPTINCNYFKFAQKPIDFELKVGIEVELGGSVGIYTPRSTYNLTVRRVQKVGAGDILAKLQQIRERLLKEGLIKTADKRRPLPLLPKRVGIVTGAGTAAFRDMLRQAQERYPNAEILLAPALVQGENAPVSIIAALEEIQQSKWECDVIIVGRGGGSPEDLMPFSDEGVCRAISACPIPVVSAVGHQIDHPIADDVADYAAATPTDGARAVFPIVDDLRSKVDGYVKRASGTTEGLLRTAQERFLRTSEKEFWEKPYLLVKDQARFLDELESRLHFHFRHSINAFSNAYAQLKPLGMVLKQRLTYSQSEFQKTAARFDAYSPLATLARGYSVVYKEDKIITDSHAVILGDKLRIRLAKGSVDAAILSVKHN